MKFLPLGLALLLPGLTLPAQAQVTTQQLLSQAQTAYLRGDLEAARRDFALVNRADPRNPVAANYLRLIQAKEASRPRGNEQEKALSQVLLPSVDLQEASLSSVIDYLRQAVPKASEGQQAVNFVLAVPEEQARTQTVTLRLRNVPVTEVLRYVGELAHVRFIYEKYAIKVQPAAAAAVPAP